MHRFPSDFVLLHSSAAAREVTVYRNTVSLCFSFSLGVLLFIIISLFLNEQRKGAFIFRRVSTGGQKLRRRVKTGIDQPVLPSSSPFKVAGAPRGGE